MPPADAYSFRPATAEDLPLLRRWLAAPEVVRWWGDPAEEERLLAEGFGEEGFAMWIVSWADRPFAYVQDYDVDTWPQAHLAGLPPGARAIDTFIGKPDLLGAGHGAAYLRRHAERLLADGAPLVVIDPDADNLRARRAYAKAGFVGDAVVPSAEGPVVVMTFSG